MRAAVKSSFIWLVAAYGGLIAYESLFPFSGWQAVSTPTFAFLTIALEWSQQWIPGRYGDLTTVVPMALAWAACFLACPRKHPDESVGVPAGVRSVVGRCLIAGIAVPLALLPASARAAGNVHRVGPQQALKTPSAAARVAGDGDIVEIEAGTYTQDVAVWRQNGLIIRAVGGRAHLRADGAHAEGKAIWVIKGADTTIEHIEFSGAKVPDRNGAGIRLEGPGLTVRYSYFHHNENGILGGRLGSDLLIEHSEFAHNGFGDGQSHNLYVSARSFTLRYSYLHHAIVGHNVKSRSLRNYIAYNRIMDERDGRASYAIDLPDGGISAVIGNLIQQGPRNENRSVVAFGAEGYKHPVNELHFVNNTVVNDDPKGGRFLFIRRGAHVVRVVNNVFAGRGELSVPPGGELRNNRRAARSELIDPDRFDYRLRAGTPAIGHGIDAGTLYGVPLRPDAEYRHPLQMRPRSAARALDLGALEFRE